MGKYTFDTVMTKEVLENYLSRAVSAQWLYMSDTIDDDIRVIKKIGAKFLGRVTGIWKPETDDDEHFRLSKECADKIHAADDEIILQACIFEMVYRFVETIPIPPWVFSAFGLKDEKRCFNYENMIFPEKPKDFVTGETNGIPDINRLEARMWFYYRAVRYIDVGYEAFHFGQIHLYSANDRDLSKLSQLISMVRDYGRKNARRHKVLIDAHSHGIIIHSKSLLDYNAMPFTRFPLLEREGEKLVLVREGNSDGGISPDGWEADCLPFLMEYDNWGGKDIEAHATLTKNQRAWSQWWGYDQIAWFANQDEKSRNSFLDYTYKWILVNNPDAYFAFPLRRPIESGETTVDFKFYKMNNKSEKCPDGFSQEDITKSLLEKDVSQIKKLANPHNMLDYGARKIQDEKSGIRLPEKIVLYGSFQPFVGATENDSNSEITRMYYIGDNTYSLSFVMPYKGEYDFAVSTWGTLSACYGSDDRYPRSGTGHKSRLTIENDNTVVNIKFRFLENKTVVTTI